jgi:hypothetical protein
VTNPSSGTFKASSGTFKVYKPRDTLRIGDSVRILNNKTAFRKGYEPTFGKTIYQIDKGDGYSFSLRDEFGVPLDRRYKLYELQKVTAMERYHHQNPVRERPLTQQQRRNKRELEDLLEHTVEPLHKKRKTFTGNYFLGKLHNMKIDSYEQYLGQIRNWDNLNQDEHEQLRKWYRDYYQKNKEKERKRYREYDASNSDVEKERVKRTRSSKDDS